LEQYQKAFNIETVILRVPGIYGPGRLPEARIRAGLPVVLPEESPWSNRIHADDLAEACFKACTEATVTGVFNVSDGHPSTMTDYFWKVSDHLDLPRPPAVSLSEARNILSPAMMSFMDESKRLCNRRMIDILGVKLRYPTLSEGLQAS
jgi:nucleoside-diphosphate-sugar epimerase